MVTDAAGPVLRQNPAAVFINVDRWCPFEYPDVQACTPTRPQNSSAGRPQRPSNPLFLIGGSDIQTDEFARTITPARQSRRPNNAIGAVRNDARQAFAAQIL